MSTKRRRQQSRGSLAPVLLIVIGTLILVGALIALALTNANNGQTTTLPQQEIPFPEIERVSLEDAKSALDQNQAVFLDVRSAQAYDAGHIPGAVLVPLNELESRANELDPNQWIITYCT